MQSICLADGEGVSQGFRSQFSIPEGSLGARKGTRKKLCKSEVATKMGAKTPPKNKSKLISFIEKVFGGIDVVRRSPESAPSRAAG